MFDLNWMTTEVQRLNGTFHGVFYTLVALFISIGIVLEYFRLPLGGIPSAGVLVGRALVAVVLLLSYRDVANTLGQVSDELAAQIGNLGSRGREEMANARADLDLRLQELGRNAITELHFAGLHQ